MDKSAYLKAYWEKIAYSSLNIEECGEEQIHHCGAIQSETWFLIYRAETEEILAISENLSELFGLDKETLLRTPFGKLPLELPEQHDLKEQSARILNLKLPGRPDLSLIGRSTLVGDTIYFEIENDKEKSSDNTEGLESIRYFLRNSSNHDGLEKILSNVSELLRKFTGYDRIMVYKFEPNGDGLVTSEARASVLEPFLGLRYPAADIPRQARELFYQSASRTIIDTQSLPASLYSKQGTAPGELDLTHSYYRATSPFHIHYLLNMGVRATFSLPIKVDGKLWGLIACHHYDGPKKLDHATRMSCEIIGQFISAKVASYLGEKKLLLKNSILELSQKILDQMSAGKSPLNSFRSMGDQLLEAVNADGLVVKFGDGKTYFGNVPGEESIEQLSQHLKQLHATTVWNSVKLSEQGLPFDKNGVGCLAVPLSVNFEDYLIWFRPAALQTINWAGQPRDLKSSTEDRLTPRGSFQLWTESREDLALEWSPDQIDSAQYVLFSFVRDIFRKASELSKANKELEKVTRAKDEFIGMVSHELRTPLNVIVGWTQIASELSIQDPVLKQAVETIDRNAKIQVNLINDLLDISRIISGKMRIKFEPDVDLKAIITQVVQDLSPTASAKGVVLKKELFEEFPTSGAPDRLKQIVWNLVSNAIKFTPKGGQVNVQLTKLASSYQIIISDTGIGIESKDLPLIFDRFQQVDMSQNNRRLGLGLGLSIVKALVELHGGEVAAQSFGANKGSVFTVTLPVYAVPIENEDDRGDNDALEHSDSLHRLKILMAEDQEDALRALEIILTSMGAEVVAERDGKSAFAQFASSKAGEFDIIISDIGMPEWNGYTLIRNIRELEASRKATTTPAIGLTAYATAKDRIACLNAGYQYHLPKPAEKSELAAVILSLVNKNDNKPTA